VHVRLYTAKSGLFVGDFVSDVPGAQTCTDGSDDEANSATVGACTLPGAARGLPPGP